MNYENLHMLIDNYKMYSNESDCVARKSLNILDAAHLDCEDINRERRKQVLLSGIIWAHFFLIVKWMLVIICSIAHEEQVEQVAIFYLGAFQIHYQREMIILWCCCSLGFTKKKMLAIR